MMAAHGQAVRRGALLVLLLVLTGCGPTAGSYDMGDRAIRYDSVPELVATAAAVVVGRVDEAVREPTVRQVDIEQTPLRVRVTVEQRLAGADPGPTVTFALLGWQRTVPRSLWDRLTYREVALRPYGLDWHQGQRVLLFLGCGDGQRGYIPLAGEGVYLLDRGDVAETDRPDPLIERVERLGVAELEHEIATAAAAARRGELHPKTIPGERPAPRRCH
jgi:hypothetical protein